MALASEELGPRAATQSGEGPEPTAARRPWSRTEACCSGVAQSAFQPRPGVDTSSLFKSAQRIQASWRNSLQHRRFQAAKHTLALPRREPSALAAAEARAEALCAAGAGGQPVLPPDPARFRMRILPPDPEAPWDEAMSYRQISINQAMQTQTRWLMDSSEPCSAAVQLEVLAEGTAPRLVQLMTCTEQKHQLRRRREDPAEPWRPPCALGHDACMDIERDLEHWLGTVRRLQSDDGSRAALGLLMAPCFCLFQLIVAGSLLYRGHFARARHFLGQVEEALRSAPPGSFLLAVASQLQARVMLLLARAALRSGNSSAAVAAARGARALLEERQGPRNFWPSHCWELAVCHRTAALALVRLGRYGEAWSCFAALGPLLAPSSMKTAAPRLVSCLTEDIAVLRLECEVAERADCCAEAAGAPPEVLQALMASTEQLVKHLQGQHMRARALALSAKLTLLQELPWFLMGSPRPEALASVVEQLSSARQHFSAAAEAQKVAPVELVCITMQGDLVTACGCAAAWASHCQVIYGEEECGKSGRAAGFCRCAARLAEDLAAFGLGPAEESSPQGLRRRAEILREVLALTSVGVLEEGPPCTTRDQRISWEPSFLPPQATARAVPSRAS